MIIECEILAHSSICVRIKLVWPIRRCVTSLRGIEMDESRFIGDKFIVSIEKKNGIFYEFHTLKLYDHSKSFIDLMNKLKNSLILNSSTENQHAIVYDHAR